MNQLNSRLGYSPVLNPLDLMFDGPLELIPGHFIQRASPVQVPEIQKRFFGVAGHDAFLVAPIYECQFIQEEGRGRWEPMPRDRWRYNVINYVAPLGQSLAIRDIELVSNVSEVPLELPLSVLGDGGIVGYGAKMSYFFLDAPSIFSQSASQEQLADIGLAYEEFSRIRKDYQEIERALNLFESLKSFPRHSEFRLLGLFAIIEMLITHNPAAGHRHAS